MTSTASCSPASLSYDSRPHLLELKPASSRFCTGRYELDSSYNIMRTLLCSRYSPPPLPSIS